MRAETLRMRLDRLLRFIPTIRHYTHVRVETQNLSISGCTLVAMRVNRIDYTITQFRYTHDLHILIGIGVPTYRVCNYLRQSRRDGGEYFRDTITTSFSRNLNFTKNFKVYGQNNDYNIA